MRYHAAVSNVDDDELERKGDLFGAPYGESGFGTSEVFQELLSRDPKYVPVSDLAAYQQGLIDTGYLPPTYVATGGWDATSAAADRRASRDAFNTSKGGGSYLAAGPRTLFRYLGYTVPTSVMDGMTGIAQGIVEDAQRAITNPVEIAEEGGLLGGAAVGAGIGGILGSILPGPGTAIGALIGGGVGGVAGFFGDLFDDDEDEEGDWQRIVGALSPLDEIRSGDAKNLFAALSTIMTASAILKSVQVARAGLQGASVVTGAQTAGGMALPTVATGARTLATRQGWRMAARADVSPGVLNQMAQATLKHRTIGTAVLGGTVNAGHELVTTGDVGQAIKDFGTGALIGAGASKLGRTVTGGKTVAKGADKLIRALDAAPLARIQASAAGQVAQAVYTGVAAPTIVARGIGEVSRYGLDTEAQKRGYKDFEELQAADTTLSKKLLKESSATAIGEDIEEADTAQRLGAVGTAIDLSVGSLVFPSRLIPWKADDVANSMKAMSSNHVLLPHANYLRTKKSLSLGNAMKELRTVYGEGDSVLLSQRVTDDYIQSAIETNAGRAVQERLSQMKPPKDAYERKFRAELEAEMLVEERSKIKENVLSQAAELGKESDIPKTPLGQQLLNEGMADPIGMQTYLAAKGYDFSTAPQHKQASEYLNRRRAMLQEEEGFHYTPAVKGEYLVAQDYEDARMGYERAATRYAEARKALETADDATIEQLDMAAFDAGKGLEDELVAMRNKGIIDDDILATLTPGTQGFGKVEKRLLNHLEETAKKRPRRDDELTAELDQVLGPENRYMAVKTGENMLDYTHFLDQAEITGIDEYARHTNFFDAISALGARVDKADLGKLRYQSIVNHLDKTAGENLKDMDGKQLADAIYDNLKGRYDVETAKRKGVAIKVQAGTIIRREDDATGKVTRELFKVDPRDLGQDDIAEVIAGRVKPGTDVYDAAAAIKRSLHVGAAFGADVAHPIKTARMLGTSFRVQGAPGFNDFIRTINFVPRKLQKKLPGNFAKGSYGYIPQHLRRFHMALQFSLSPTFDASRMAEAAMFGKIRGGDIPIKLAGTGPKKWVHEFEEGWISPSSGRRVKGKEATDEMLEFGDRVLYGRAANQNFDELQLRLLHNGILGFKPRETEYAQAWWLAQKKLRNKGYLDESDHEAIRETVMQIGQYGTKQTPLGNTAHFIFFPFLFQKKQVGAIIDFTLGAPARNLMVHEGVRRWYQVTGEDGNTMSEDFSRLVEKHAPLLADLGRLNNLAYGVSPGRFFLEGIIDKDEEGQVAQGLMSVLAPGGVHSTIGDTAGQAVQLFMPQVWTEDSVRQAGGMTGALGLIERMVPMYRDVDRWLYDQDKYGSPFGIVGAQIQAMSGRGVPKVQMGEYLDEKRVLTSTLETLAASQGVSLETLTNNNPELAVMVEELENDLTRRYPDGARLAAEFTNKDSIKEQALLEIADKGERTMAEEAINLIAGYEVQAKEIADASDLTQEEVLRAISPSVRALGSAFVTDRQFVDLWDGLYRDMWGPLRRIEVA